MVRIFGLSGLKVLIRGVGIQEAGMSQELHRYRTRRE